MGEDGDDLCPMPPTLYAKCGGTVDPSVKRGIHGLGTAKNSLQTSRRHNRVMEVGLQMRS
jgi:hypothetical protein